MLQSAAQVRCEGPAVYDFSGFRESWSRIGLSTQAAQREEAEVAVRRAYTAAGLAAPAKIVWCGSPLSQGIARDIVLDTEFMGTVVACAWDAAKNSSGTNFRDDIVDCFRGSVRLGDTASVKRDFYDAVKAGVTKRMQGSIAAAMKSHIRASVVDSVWRHVWDAVWASVEHQIRHGIETGMRRAIDVASKRGLDEAVANSLKDCAGSCVKSKVWDEAMDKAWANIRNGIGSQVRVRAWDNLWNCLQPGIWKNVAVPIGECIKASSNDSAQASGYGQHDAYWLSFYAYFREVEGLTAETEQICGLLDIARTAGWFIPHEKICWICERPNMLSLDADGMLHSDKGPALAYPDGWSLYASAGVLRFQAAPS
jgi:hypothetical protein